jgi:hypothetical protein
MQSPLAHEAASDRSVRRDCRPSARNLSAGGRSRLLGDRRRSTGALQVRPPPGRRCRHSVSTLRRRAIRRCARRCRDRHRWRLCAPSASRCRRPALFRSPRTSRLIHRRATPSPSWSRACPSGRSSTPYREPSSDAAPPTSSAPRTPSRRRAHHRCQLRGAAARFGSRRLRSPRPLRPSPGRKRQACTPGRRTASKGSRVHPQQDWAHQAHARAPPTKPSASTGPPPQRRASAGSRSIRRPALSDH